METRSALCLIALKVDFAIGIQIWYSTFIACLGTTCQIWSIMYWSYTCPPHSTFATKSSKLGCLLLLSGKSSLLMRAIMTNSFKQKKATIIDNKSNDPPYRSHRLSLFSRMGSIVWHILFFGRALTLAF